MTLKCEKEMKIYSKRKKSIREYKNSKRLEIRFYNTSLSKALHVIL
jgi:hypothetical protein